MKKNNFFGLLIALFAINNACAVDLLIGAPVTSVRGANYNNFNKQYKGYLIDAFGEVDKQWVQGAVAALRQDGMYNANTFFNVLWGHIEPLVDYYAQGNQAFKNNVRNSLELNFNMAMYGALIAPTTQTMVPPAPRPAPRPLPSIPAKLTIQSILGGALGEPYTSRANQVYNSGIQIYVDALARDINRDVNASYSNESTRIDSIKRNIDKNYNFLSQYRGSNVTQAPGPQSLTLQSILGGALGEPYTSKANQVYNSGVQVYVDALVRDINRDINASYSDESRRIQSIKTSIDKHHNFLSQYRR